MVRLDAEAALSARQLMTLITSRPPVNAAQATIYSLTFAVTGYTDPVQRTTERASTRRSAMRAVFATVMPAEHLAVAHGKSLKE